MKVFTEVLGVLYWIFMYVEAPFSLIKSLIIMALKYSQTFLCEANKASLTFPKLNPFQRHY